MKNHLRKASYLAVVVPILILGTSAQADEMKGAEIKAALSGKSFKYSKGSSRGTLQYLSNGKIIVTYSFKGKERHKAGTWFTRGNKFCSKMVRRGSKGKETVKCTRMTNLGGGKFKTADGVTITPD